MKNWFSKMVMMMLAVVMFFTVPAKADQSASHLEALRVTLGALKAQVLANTVAVSAVASDTANLRLSMAVFPFVTQSFSLAAAGSGTPLTLTVPMSTFGFQVAPVGGTTLINWDAKLQGSLNGVTYTNLVSHSYAVGTEGITVWAADKAVMYLKSTMTAITLGGESTGAKMNLVAIPK